MSDVLSLHKTVQLLDSMCQLHSIDADTERNDLLQEVYSLTHSLIYVFTYLLTHSFSAHLCIYVH